MTGQHGSEPDNLDPRNGAKTPDQRLSAQRRAKAQHDIAAVQRRLDAAQHARFARLADRHGAIALAEAVERFPTLAGDDDTDSALADQIETGMMLPRRLVGGWLTRIPNPSTRSLVLALLAEDDHGDDGTREPRLRYGDPLGRIADDAVASYGREFGSSTLDPTVHLVGFTREPHWPNPSIAPDTRAYAIMARWPFERTPILTEADLNSFFADARRFKMCDLRLKGGYCDGGISTESSLIPLIRGDVIVFVAMCQDCAKRYRKRRGISRGEIVSP